MSEIKTPSAKSSADQVSIPEMTGTKGPVPRRGAAWVRWWPVLPLVVISAYYVAHAAWVFAARAVTPYSVSVVESQTVAGAFRVARGETLYQEFRNQRPVVPLTYLGLTYEVPGLVARWSGWTSALEVARLGRALSLLSFAGIVLLLTGLSKQRGVSARWGWSAALPLIWFPYPAEWLAKFAPDAPALFFSLLGWWLVGPHAGAEEDGDRAAMTDENSGTGARVVELRRFAAVAAWLIGVHFKPNVLAGPIAFGVERVWAGLSARKHARKADGGSESGPQAKKAFRELIFVGGAFAGLAMASLLALHVLTGGRWYDSFVRSTAAFRYDFDFVFGNLKKLRPEGMTALGVIVLWAGMQARRGPLPVAFFATLSLGLLLMLKQGSNVNYLLDALTLGGLAVVVGVARGLKETIAGRWNPKPVALLWPALFLAAALLIHPEKARIVYWEMFQPSAEELREIDAAVESLADDQVLCLDSFYGLSRERPVLFADPFHVSILEQEGLVSFRPEIERVEQRVYKLVIWNLVQANRVRYHGVQAYPQDLSDALERNYRQVYRGNWLVVWAPKQAQRQ